MFDTDRAQSERKKPKLLFFQYRYDERLPRFLLVHKKEHVACLSQSFEVKVITKDCDYEELCDGWQPDVALFESGVPFATCSRLRISNTQSHRHIPKLGLLHSDAFCEARAGFLADMDRWGIETFFAIATAAPEYNPAIARNLFIWPNFIDPAIYRDYGQEKNIPVLFTGNAGALYPWRKKILRLVSERYPTLSCPHPGYSPQKALLQILTGERYARMLNASTFVPACGTVAKEVVRKHFEIPACRACLVTEDSPALRAAGFVDMQNCVFATERDVLDKLAYLFDQPDKLQSITNAGYELVHARHTLGQRDQLRQWLELRRNLKPGEVIVQPNPFAPLRAVAGSETVPVFASGGQHLALLRQGDEALANRRYEEAQSFYARCLAYYRFMPEPQLRLALAGLYQGDSRRALTWLEKPLAYILVDYKSSEPDPVEWAYFLLALACAGRLKEAQTRAEQFLWLRHSELDRARIAISILAGKPSPEFALNSRPRRSVHSLPERSWQAWMAEIGRMLRACGQEEFAARLLDGRANERCVGVCGSGQASLPGHEPAAVRWFARRQRLGNAKLNTRRRFGRVLRALEARFGYFLPYRLSSMRSNPFFCAIQRIAAEEPVSAVLAISGNRPAAALEALQAAAGERAPRLNVVHLRGLDQRNLADVERAKPACGFDLVLLDGSALSVFPQPSDELKRILSEARFVVIEGAAISNAIPYLDLFDNPRFRVIDEDAEQRGGYAIFERLCGEMTRPENHWQAVSQVVGD